MHTWYSAVPAAPLPQKLYKKDGWLWVVYCPFCFCFSIYCNFFLGVALFFFSDFIRRDQKRSFQTVFGMFLLMVLSHLSSLLSVSGISPDMISQDALGGNAKAIMVRAPEKCRI